MICALKKARWSPIYHYLLSPNMAKSLTIYLIKHALEVGHPVKEQCKIKLVQGICPAFGKVHVLKSSQVLIKALTGKLRS